MPEGERLAPGEHGFTGKKRGELRIRHIPLLHPGAGVWLAYRLVAESTVVPVLAELLTGGLRGLPAARTIVRGDGEFGSVGAIRTVAYTGAHHLARLSRYLPPSATCSAQSTLDVHIGSAAVRRRAAHPLVTRDASERRHGRKTWSQRRARWAADADVLFVATGPGRELLHGFH